MIHARLQALPRAVTGCVRPVHQSPNPATLGGTQATPCPKWVGKLVLANLKHGAAINPRWIARPVVRATRVRGDLDIACPVALVPASHSQYPVAVACMADDDDWTTLGLPSQSEDRPNHIHLVGDGAHFGSVTNRAQFHAHSPAAKNPSMVARAVGFTTAESAALKILTTCCAYTGSLLDSRLASNASTSTP